ncbi:MAG TPA: sigma-70 family RNA polymerase sigma factor [Lacisediminihabitans sp.]|uniref:sigma-70 family RNA polymerase sigma factor n=1 Tax=Lacisediminihabitans sp. TaxID=2787631 RepID=UPI002ED7C089
MVERQDELLRALHDEHAPALWRYVVWLTGDRHFAEDVVQETLVRAWRRPQVLDQSGGSTRAWLFTVARNLVIDDRRSAHARHEIAAEQLPERASEDGTEAMFDAWVVSDALASISDDHRRVVVLSYYQGRSVAEISTELGIPEGTVKSRLHYALRALRLALQERGVTA